MNGRKLIWSLFAAAVALQLGTGIYLYVQIGSLRRDKEDLEWHLEKETVTAHQDRINTKVGEIQFLRRGYSIVLEGVNYTQDGLRLKGYVGNPTNLSISNLTLNFRAYKPLDEYRYDYLKRSGRFKMDPIGEAQSSPIASLAPGTIELFEVTIPNVKQTKDGIRLTVSFFGERYGYRPSP
jgi:hypothetical protein